MNIIKVNEVTNFAELFTISLDKLLEVLPQNILIRKDSGTWCILDEDFKDLVNTEWHWDLKTTVIHYLLSLEMDERLSYDWHILYS